MFLKKRFYSWLLRTVSIALLFSSNSLIHAENNKISKFKIKIAFIDLEQCMNETEDGLRAKSLFRKLTERRQGNVYMLEQKLAERQEALVKLQKSASGPTDKTFMEAALNFEKERMEYSSTVKNINDELTLKRDEIEKPIRIKIEQILNRIGQTEGYALVINRKALARGPTDLDLTARVIHEYNWGKKP